MDKKSEMPQAKKYAETYGGTLVSGLPMVVMLGGILVCAFTGLRSPICYWSAGVISIMVGFFIYKDKREFSEAILEGIGNRILRTMMFALFFAGIMSKIIATGGLVSGLVWLTSTINMPAALIPEISFLIAALMSTATGTSLGTVTAIAPILVPLAAALGSYVPLTCGAILSGAVFGDNLAPVSDTTIASSLTQQTEVGRVVRSRIKYALLGGGISSALFIVLGFTMSQSGIGHTVEADPATAINLVFLIVPALVVILMLKTGNLITSLLMGDLAGIVLLFLMGRVDYEGFAGKEGLVANGISGMINVTVFVWFIFIVTGIVQKAGTLDKMIEWLQTKAKTSRSAEIICNCITTCIVVCIVSSSATCALGGALERNIIAPYHIARDRTANMLDGMACGVAGLLPYSSNVLTIINIAVTAGAMAEDVAPFDVLAYNFHCMALVLIFWVCAITGWGRTYETDEQLAAEGIYLDPATSVPIPEGAKISKYQYKGVHKDKTSKV
ncbi:Na+/H+ antiporter NhaC family protein [Clostridiales bacterium]